MEFGCGDWHCVITIPLIFIGIPVLGGYTVVKLWSIFDRERKN